jgi:hypothetical protein
VGGFPGARLGSQVYESIGNFEAVWLIDIVLAVDAVPPHLPMREASAVRPAAAAVREDAPRATSSRHGGAARAAKPGFARQR